MSLKQPNGSKDFDPVFHDQAVIMNAGLATDFGKELMKIIENRKQGCLLRLSRNESGVEFAGVTSRPEGVTIVILNKDELQHELSFWLRLEGQFKEWAAEAIRQPQVEE